MRLKSDKKGSKNRGIKVSYAYVNRMLSYRYKVEFIRGQKMMFIDEKVTYKHVDKSCCYVNSRVMMIAINYTRYKTLI